MNPRPKIIALAGPSGGGKSALADLLAQMIEKPRCQILGVDWFYRDLSGLPESERRQVNFDHPDSIDWPLLQAVLQGLAQGTAMHCPVYDFLSHTRAGHSRLIKPGSYLIVEGLFALFPMIRELAQTLIYVDAPSRVCLLRILKRDLQERAWSQQDVVRRFDEQIWPMYLEHVRPTKAHAHLVIDGLAPLADSAKKIARLMEGMAE